MDSLQYVEICNEHGYCVVKIVPPLELASDVPSGTHERISEGKTEDATSRISFAPRSMQKETFVPFQKKKGDSMKGFGTSPLTLTTEEEEEDVSKDDSIYKI